MAIVQLTNAGAALLAANAGPIQLSTYQLGSDYNYVPEPTDTAIHGTLVYSGAPSPYVVINANVVKYSIYLDYPAGPFEFGEFGLFTSNGTLFALAALDALVDKLPSSDNGGNSIRMDVYLSMVATNYAMWLDYGTSNNQFAMAVLGSVDQLPAPQDATPNAYVITSATAFQSSFLAYTDRTGLWNFDAYDYANQASATVVSADSQSVTITTAQYNPDMNPTFAGQVIVEFSSGQLFGICRYVTSAVESGGNVTLGFDNPLMQTPNAGDTFNVLVRQALTVDEPIPPATTSVIGGVIVGASLTVTDTGLLNVNDSVIPYPVTTVSGQTGAVVIEAENSNGATGTTLIVDSGATDGTIKLKTIVAGTNITLSADGNGNLVITGSYSLPVASTTVLGGVKAPTSGTITIAGDGTLGLGFSPVSSVNGNTGAVVIDQANPSGFATVAFTGNYADLTNGYVLPAATTSTLGGVIVGAGLSVSAGTVSLANVAVASTNSGTGSSLVVVAGTTGVTPASIARISGGSGITVTPDGSNNLVIASTVAGGVTSVNTLTGAVTIEAADASDASGTTLIVNNGATTGIIQLRTIVAGTNITLSTDGNNNLEIAAASAPVTSVFTRTGAVVAATGDYTVAQVTGAAPLASPTFTGVPAAPTAGAGTSTTQLATTAFVAASKYYDIPCGAPGTLTASQLIGQYTAVRTINFAANFAGSAGHAGTAATASTTITVNVNGTAVGTIVFAASGTTPTFTTTGGTAVVVTSGQTITFVAPSSADATLANVSATLLGLAT
jgi:hypothetical protein